MSEIRFKLSDYLQGIDVLGYDYIYTANKHPSADDLMVVHYQYDGKWLQSNYEKEEFEIKFKEGHWIKQ